MHPDLRGGIEDASAEFRRLSAAYEILLSPRRYEWTLLRTSHNKKSAANSAPRPRPRSPTPQAVSQQVTRPRPRPAPSSVVVSDDTWNQIIFMGVGCLALSWGVLMALSALLHHVTS